MPLMRAKGPRGGKGWKYGKSGKVYSSKAKAIKQMVAIKIARGEIKPRRPRAR